MIISPLKWCFCSPATLSHCESAAALKSPPLYGQMAQSSSEPSSTVIYRSELCWLCLIRHAVKGIAPFYGASIWHGQQHWESNWIRNVYCHNLHLFYSKYFNLCINHKVLFFDCWSKCWPFDCSPHSSRKQRGEGQLRTELMFGHRWAHPIMWTSIISPITSTVRWPKGDWDKFIMSLTMSNTDICQSEHVDSVGKQS